MSVSSPMSTMFRRLGDGSRPMRRMPVTVDLGAWP